jgi:hypothetical protein
MARLVLCGATMMKSFFVNQIEWLTFYALFLTIAGAAFALLMATWDKFCEIVGEDK